MKKIGELTKFITEKIKLFDNKEENLQNEL